METHPNSTFSQAVFDEICDRLIGGESLREICAVGSGMPSCGTFFRWLAKDMLLQEQYARAREAQAESVFEDIFKIADDGSNDTYLDNEGNTRTDHDVIGRSKLRVDTRKWALARMSPRKYGDRVMNEITNPDGSLRGSPAMTDEELANALNRLAELTMAREGLTDVSPPAAEPLLIDVGEAGSTDNACSTVETPDYAGIPGSDLI